MSWTEVLRALRPSSMRNPYDIDVLLSVKNPFMAVRNPYNSDADKVSGGELFRSHCAACHGPYGNGGSGPDLTSGEFRHGSSDWALFHTISRGIPGTAMRGFDLPNNSIWQMVAFVRSLNRGLDRTSLLSEVGDEVQSRSKILPPPQVSYERLVRSFEEPGNWLMYSGTYNSHRHSRLGQVNRHNVKKLRLMWVFQMPTIEAGIQTTPLVVGNIMFVTEPPNNVIALDTGTGQRFWSYYRELPETIPLCCGRVNRGLAVLGDRLYMGTLDGHLVSLDARTGARIWDVEVADYRKGYTIAAAPLAVKNKIIVGISGGDYGIRGFLDAYNAETGERAWRFYTVPGPGERGHETWSDDSWKTGGAATWLTGSFDPEINLIYWGVGNPAPSYNGDVRQGDNLYSSSVIALDADTGKLNWHFQFTPHDEYDWDANQIPVLIDTEFQGRQRKLLLLANRNAFFYILDRRTGEFLLAREFGKQTWAEAIDSRGRPILRPNISPSPKGTLVSPRGATNWQSPSYSPVYSLFYVPVWETAVIYFRGPALYSPGSIFDGGAFQWASNVQLPKGVRALSAQTGEVKWEYRLPARDPSMGGILSTAGNIVFGSGDKQFFALDAYTGEELWRFNMGGDVTASPITYLSSGKQQVTIASGRAIFTFGLDEN